MSLRTAQANDLSQPGTLPTMIAVSVDGLVLAQERGTQTAEAQREPEYAVVQVVEIHQELGRNGPEDALLCTEQFLAKAGLRQAHCTFAKVPQ
jgi:hypothetical protein